MRQQPPHALAHLLGLLAQWRGGAVAQQAGLQLAQFQCQAGGALLARRQRHAESGVVLAQHRRPAAVRAGGGALEGRTMAAAHLHRLRHLDALAGRRGSVGGLVDGDRVVRDVAVPRRHELLHALVQPRDVAAVGLQHALQAVLLARRRPLAAAALESAGELLDGLRPALGQRQLRLGRALHVAAGGLPVGALHRLRKLLALRAVLEQARRDAVMDVLGLGAGRGRRRDGRGRRGRRGRGTALLDPGPGIVLGRGFQLGQRQAAQGGLRGLGGGRFGHGRDGRWRPHGGRRVSTSAGRRRRCHRCRSAPSGRAASTAPSGAGPPAPSTPGCPREAAAC